ncbi:MAG: type IX secretion system membrane protein PorP/SprF [Bacteroidales bacterium]|nr:type IX secretion system membrane protein PorP/SprF [Bacteroidales bacterium]
MKRLVLYIGIMVAALTVNSQNDPQSSLYEYNRLLFNPAATAQSEYIDIHVLAREQWIGFDKAPSTQSLSISNYFSKYRSGVALTVINDQLGAESMQNIKAKYAYHAWLGEEQYISFGLGAGVMVKSFSSTDLEFEEPGDEHITDADFKETKLDFDFGMELHLHNFYVGGAINHLTHSYDNYDIMRVPRHQYSYIGYKIETASTFSLTPVFSFSNIDAINVFEASLLANYNDKLRVGIGYRLEDALILSSKISISENLLVAYSYDMTTGNLQNYRNGSHEVMLHFRINKPEKQYKSPRFFD